VEQRGQQRAAADQVAGRDEHGVRVAAAEHAQVRGQVLRAAGRDAIERVTGGPVVVSAALVRDPSHRPRAPEGILTTDFARLRDDPDIAVVAEVMGGIEPARTYVLELLDAGKAVVSANKQLLARHGEELFAAAERRGVQLRFEASVCAAIPVVKVLRESLIVSGVHRIDGIVNGTTNYILTRMVSAGASYAAALAEAQEHVGIDHLDLADVEHAAGLGYSVKLIASAMQVGHRVVARVHPCLLDAHHPLASVEGPFNAVMLRGESIREVILEGPGAGGEETATAVIGDLLAVIGTSGTGFLQHDGYYRELGRLPNEDLQSPFYLRFEVDDQPGVLAQVARALADHGVSVAQVVQHLDAGVHIVILTHRAREGDVRGAAAAVAALAFSRSEPVVLPVLERAAAGAR
jgi:homoserine dehydrogenase